MELGYPARASAATGVSVGAFREVGAAGYLQDDWKALPNLTLNLGLRYDFNNPPNDKDGNSALYLLSANQNSKGTWNTNYNDWGPRIGFSFGVLKDTVIRGGYGTYYAPILYNNLQFMLLYSPNFVSQPYSLDMRDPQDIQGLFSPNPPSVLGQGGHTITKTLKDTSAQEWNLGIQQAIRSNMLFSIAYIGSVTRHQSARADLNLPDALSSGNESGIYDVRPYSWASQMGGQLNAISANYNAMAVKLERRFINGLQFQASYTWSKAMAAVTGDNMFIENIYDPYLTWGPAGFDRTNNLIFSGIYDLPFGPGRPFAHSNTFFSREIIGGWRLSGIQRLATGQPMVIYATNDANISTIGQFYGIQVCNPNSGFTRTETQFYNPSCYAQPGPGQYGTTRSGPRQPHLVITNLGLTKTFPIVEGQQLEFRAEAFDAFNHPVLGRGSANAGQPNGGLVTSQAAGPRVMQFALRYSF